MIHRVDETRNQEHLSCPSTLCEYKCRLNIALKKHIKHEHEQKLKQCDSCDNKFGSESDLKEHMIQNHETQSKYGCNFCNYETNVLTKMFEHKFDVHPDIDSDFKPQSEAKDSKDFLLNLILEQNMALIEEVTKLKELVKDSFSQVSSVKECLGNMEEKTKSGLLTLSDKIERYASIAQKASPQVPQPQSYQKTTPPTTSHVNFSCDYSNSKNMETKTHKTHKIKKTSRFLSKQKVLYIGDSIANNVEFNSLEKATNTRIRTVKAYSSAYTDAARFPLKNVNDIAQDTLNDTHNDDEFTELVLSAPTVDITNLNTANLRPDDNIEVFKQNVVVSCQNIFSVAEQALRNHPNLKKVLILEHPPRFDQHFLDPVGLKPQLAKFANLMYNQLWLSSAYKDKIAIGSHKLDCSENQFDDRYRNTKTNRYDGIHMYGVDGKRAYTKNLVDIFRDLLVKSETAKSENHTSSSYHRTCPQTLYQEAQRKKTFAKGQVSYNGCFNVPVSNRFEVLGN